MTRGEVTIEDLNIAGGGAGSESNGLQIEGGNDAIIGLSITGFGGTGVNVSSNANTIGAGMCSGAGNLISENGSGVGLVGTSATGTPRREPDRHRFRRNDSGTEHVLWGRRLRRRDR